MYHLRTALTAALTVLALASPADAESLRLHASLAQPYVLAGGDSRGYLKVSIVGGGDTLEHARPTANLAIVLDKSGSMGGQKIADARAAAAKAVSMLAPDDIVSVIAYDDGVRVVVPATRAADRDRIVSGINAIQAGGSTALFAGVSAGAAELRKFYDRRFVNRVILLSDGLANVGPSSPADLGELGTSLGREGIAVTTIGLGLDYNEDLMSQLAMQSDGNHIFAEEPGDLDDVFAEELGDVTNVVAQNVEIIINCANGARPLRVFGRDAEILGNRVIASMNQVYGDAERFVLLEVELPETAIGASALQVADVQCRFDDSRTQLRTGLNAPVSVQFTDSVDVVNRNTDKVIMASVLEQRGVEENKRALELRDKGQLDEAKQVLEDNAVMLQEGAEKYDSQKLQTYYNQNVEATKNLDNDSDWKRQRKVMREQQYQIVNQQ